MAASAPIWLYHFTRVEHLASIARDGLCCDAEAHRDGRLTVEIGNVGIKDRRTHRQVPAGPGGVVADYAPFYFAPRSPMLYSIKCGNVPTYTEGQRGLVYLCMTLRRVMDLDLAWVGTDRNAVLDHPEFTDDLIRLADLVDWPLMQETMWASTPDDPDRKERRQAELLVHRRLPWEAIEFIGTRTPEDLHVATNALATLGVAHVPASAVRPRWYF